MSDSPGIPDREFQASLAEEVQEPRLFKVLLHNDDYTTMDFVVRVLKEVFRKPEPEALQIMLNVHHKGVGVCGVYTVEVAETKVSLVESMSRQAGYPLRSTIEEV